MERVCPDIPERSPLSQPSGEVLITFSAVPAAGFPPLLRDVQYCSPWKFVLRISDGKRKHERFFYKIVEHCIRTQSSEIMVYLPVPPMVTWLFSLPSKCKVCIVAVDVDTLTDFTLRCQRNTKHKQPASHHLVYCNQTTGLSRLLVDYSREKRTPACSAVIGFAEQTSVVCLCYYSVCKWISP